MSLGASHSGDVPFGEEVGGARSTGWWGMLIFIVAELALFGSLLAGYFYLRFLAPQWPPPEIEDPNLVVGGIATVILLASSYPMWWAERGIRAGRRARLRLGLAAAFVLGLAFLGIQAHEYLSSEFSISTNAYGSLFFTITGFHGAHVIVGLLLNAALQVRAWRGDFTEERHGAVETVALYWHFVDVVWIFIFMSLYVSPHVH